MIKTYRFAGALTTIGAGRTRALRASVAVAIVGVVVLMTARNEAFVNRGLAAAIRRGDYSATHAWLALGADPNTFSYPTDGRLHLSGAWWRTVPDMLRDFEGDSEPKTDTNYMCGPLVLLLSTGYPRTRIEGAAAEEAAISLINGGANVRELFRYGDSIDIEPPIFAAVDRGWLRGVEAMLNHGADPCSSTSDRRWVLQEAVLRNDPAMISLLLRHGAAGRHRGEEVRDLIRIAIWKHKSEQVISELRRYVAR